jgi:hypothetical protein
VDDPSAPAADLPLRPLEAGDLPLFRVVDEHTDREIGASTDNALALLDYINCPTSGGPFEDRRCLKLATPW